VARKAEMEERTSKNLVGFKSYLDKNVQISKHFDEFDTDRKRFQFYNSEMAKRRAEKNR
jgi:hypothetical protein